MVTTSGFVIDPELSSLHFREEDKACNLFSTRHAYSRVVRYREKDGERFYTLNTPMRQYREKEDDYRRRIRDLRDTLVYINHWWDSRFVENTMTLSYPCDQMFIYFGYDYHAGVDCSVELIFDTIPAPSGIRADSINLSSSVWIYTFSDTHNDIRYKPDSVYLVFDRMPGADCPSLKGHLYAGIKDFDPFWGDIFFEGEFMVDMRQ